MTEIPEVPSFPDQTPAVRSIIEGLSSITYMGEGSFAQSRNVAGEVCAGQSDQYEVTLPHPTNPGESLTTYLTRWEPLPLPPKTSFENRPDPQLFITTGKGEIPISTDPTVVNRIFAEINRQMDKQKKAAEEKATKDATP